MNKNTSNRIRVCKNTGSNRIFVLTFRNENEFKWDNNKLRIIPTHYPTIYKLLKNCTLFRRHCRRYSLQTKRLI